MSYMLINVHSFSIYNVTITNKCNRYKGCAKRCKVNGLFKVNQTQTQGISTVGTCYVIFYFPSTFSPGYHDGHGDRSIHDILPCETVHKTHTHTNNTLKGKSSKIVNQIGTVCFIGCQWNSSFIRKKTGDASRRTCNNNTKGGRVSTV